MDKIENLRARRGNALSATKQPRPEADVTLSSILLHNIRFMLYKLNTIRLVFETRGVAPCGPLERLQI